MSVWFIDGFDHYSDNPFASPPGGPASTDFTKKWTSASLTPSIHPGYARQQPGQGMRLGNMTVGKTRPGTNVDTYIIGYAFLLSVVSTAQSTGIIIFDDTLGTEQTSVRTDGSGHILFNRGATNLATSTNVLSPNVWYYLEAKVKVHNTAGAYEVRINGSSTGWVPPATGANTRSTANNQLTGFRINCVNGPSLYIDDLYAADATGSVNNDFLGPQMVVPIQAIGAGNYTQWTPNFGTNFGNVNERCPDGDATFNQDGTAGHKDSFLMQDLPVGVGTVTAIQHVLYAKQDSGAQRVVRPFQRDGGGDHAGTSFNLSTSYQMLMDVKDVDPNTGSQFTVSNFNAAEMGYELVS